MFWIWDMQPMKSWGSREAMNYWVKIGGNGSVWADDEDYSAVADEVEAATC